MDNTGIMIGRIFHILTVTGAMLLCMACGREGKVIPKGKMAEIYADMFVADQWITQNYRASRTADTTVVYEAVFRKYGYDSEDYRASVEHYIQDPDRYARILRQTVVLLDERIAEKKAELKKLKALEANVQDIVIEFDFDRIWIFENGYPRLTVRDSLEYFRDRQEYFILDLKPFADPDSTGISPYFPQDSLITPDTTAASDTTATHDTTAAHDSADTDADAEAGTDGTVIP